MAETNAIQGYSATNKIENQAVKGDFKTRTIAFFSLFDKARWMWFGTWCFLVLVFCIIAANIAIQINKNGGHSLYESDGWTALDKFTYQSNILCLIYATFYVWFPTHQFLRRGKFLIATTVYIFFTFVGYNFILTGMNGGYFDTLKSSVHTDFPFTLFEHLFAPLLFIGCALAQMYLKPIQTSTYWRSLLPGMIYPTIYVIYAATIPFVQKEPYAFYNISDWDSAKEVATAVHAGKTGVYSVYGLATDTVNYPEIAWPIILVVWLVFFPASYAIFYYSCQSLRKRAYINHKTPAGNGCAL